MITSQVDFENLYGVSDGEVASEAVLNRPSYRLKKELLEVSQAVNVLMGDTSSVPTWTSGTYESGVLSTYGGKQWKSLVANNTSVPGTNALHWEDLSTLTEAFSNLSSGVASTPEIVEAVNSFGFPAEGAIATIYIAKDTNIMYRWSGTQYVELTSGAGGTGGGTALVMGMEAFTASANQTAFTVAGSVANGAMVYIEGVLASESTYNVNVDTHTITLNEPLQAGTKVQIGCTTLSIVNVEGFIPAERVLVTAVAGQTTFVATYVPGDIDVYRNGLKLPATDFTATSGTSIVLDVPCVDGDIIEIMSFNSVDNAGIQTIVNAAVDVAVPPAVTAAVGATIDASLALKLDLAGGVMTGAITSFREKSVSMSTDTINCALGNLFIRTVAGDTTFTLSNIPASGQAFNMTFEVTNAGAYSVTWWSGIKWAGGNAPTLTVSGTDILSFYTYDGGVTWKGLVLAKDIK